MPERPRECDCRCGCQTPLVPDGAAMGFGSTSFTPRLCRYCARGKYWHDKHGVRNESPWEDRLLRDIAASAQEQ